VRESKRREKMMRESKRRFDVLFGKRERREK